MRRFTDGRVSGVFEHNPLVGGTRMNHVGGTGSRICELKHQLQGKYVQLSRTAGHQGMTVPELG